MPRKSTMPDAQLYALRQVATLLSGVLGRLMIAGSMGLDGNGAQSRQGILGRILGGNIYGAALDQAARDHVVAAQSLTAAAGALIGSADALTAAAGVLAAGAGAGGAGGAGSAFINQAFGGKLSGLLTNSAIRLPALGRLLGGKAGAIAGAAGAGAIVGATGAGFGIAGLGTVGGALLGGAITGGIAAGLLFGLPKLFSRGQSPAERSAEIDRILEGQRFSLPEPIEREVGFGRETSGGVDYGFGDVPRIAPPMQVNVTVNAMDSRSFLDRAPEIASAVRRAMLDMHPINLMVREAF